MVIKIYFISSIISHIRYQVSDILVLKYSTCYVPYNIKDSYVINMISNKVYKNKNSQFM